jgi:two-component system chemotaxis sensor kinase CheA
MMNLVGELVIDRRRLLEILRNLTDRYGHDSTIEQLSDIAQHLTRVSDELQQQVMRSRLLPVESVFNRFPRMVRDLAKRSGKQVRFVVEGQETELDRSVFDHLGDPLVHLLRNALDHGVETPEERVAAGKPEEATIVLSARHEESMIVLEVTDDGRGIDPQRMRRTAIRKGIYSADAAGRLSDDEAINLIFSPGFSSAAEVTDVSGRGVGMDIVRTNIEKVNGTVTVATQLGEGTTFTIRLPLTLAIIRALLVRVGEATFTIPLVSVQETLRIQTDTMHAVHGREIALLRGQALPLLRLADVFGGPYGSVDRREGASVFVVWVRTGRADLGLIVDSLIGEQEVVIKPIDGVIGEIEGLAGATILGDGSVSMIVDVPKVVERLAARVDRPAPHPAHSSRFEVHGWPDARQERAAAG